MPIYFGKPAVASISNILAPAKGTELKATDPGSARVSLIPGRFNYIGHYMYMHWAELLTASKEKKAVHTNTIVPLYETTSTSPLTLTLPNLCVRFDQGIPSNHSQSLSDIGYSRETIYGVEYLIFENPTFDQVRAISAAQPLTNNYTVANATNLDGMRMALYMQRILGAILRIAGNIIPFTQHMENHGSILFPLKTSSLKWVNSTAPGPAPQSFIQIRTGDMVLGMKFSNDNNATTDVRTVQNTSGGITTVHYGIFTLGAVFNIDTTKFQPATNIPGFTLPFDRDFAEPDFHVVPKFFATYARLVLGVSEDASVQRANAIGSAWGNLNKTSWGLQVAHLVVCLQLAINTQSNLITKVVNGRYVGCIIQNLDLSAGLYGSYVQAVPYSTLREEQIIIDRQTLNLKKIIEITGGDTYDNLHTPSGDERFKSVTSYRSLRNLIHQQTTPLGPDQETEIIELAKGLEFPQRAFGHTYNFVEKVLTWCKNTVTIPDNIYLNPNYIFATDRTELAFGAFGARAPSFSIPNGAKVTLSTSQSYPTHKTKSKNGSISNTPRPNFVTRPVPIETAILEIKKIIQTRELNNFPASKSQGFTKYNATERPALFRILQELATSTTSPFTNISSGSTSSTQNPNYFSFGLDF